MFQVDCVETHWYFTLASFAGSPRLGPGNEANFTHTGNLSNANSVFNAGTSLNQDPSEYWSDTPVHGREAAHKLHIPALCGGQDQSILISADTCRKALITGKAMATATDDRSYVLYSTGYFSWSDVMSSSHSWRERGELSLETRRRSQLVRKGGRKGGILLEQVLGIKLLATIHAIRRPVVGCSHTHSCSHSLQSVP